MNVGLENSCGQSLAINPATGPIKLVCPDSLMALMILEDSSPYPQKANPEIPNLAVGVLLSTNAVWHLRQNGLPGFRQLMHGVGKKKLSKSFT